MRFDADAKARYLDALRRGNTRGAAAASAGVSRRTPELHAASDPAFAEEIDAAEAAAVARVEDALFQKAIEGNVKAILAWLHNRAPEQWKSVRRLEAKVEATLTDRGLDWEAVNRMGPDHAAALFQEMFARFGGEGRN